MSTFEDPHKQIDKVIKEKSEKKPFYDPNVSKEVTQTIDNFRFRKTFEENPLKQEHAVKAYGFKVITLNNYLICRLFPRGIYTTDKLVRLGLAASIEMQKKYIKKKRQVSIEFIWIILIIVGIVAAVLVVLLLLPKFTGAAL